MAQAAGKHNVVDEDEEKAGKMQTLFKAKDRQERYTALFGRRSKPIPPDRPSNLYTEAEAIQDWETICVYVLRRAEELRDEGTQFRDLFIALQLAYEEYYNMAARMQECILTQKDYSDVPDYHETSIHIVNEAVITACDDMVDGYTGVCATLNSINEKIMTTITADTDFLESILAQIELYKQTFLDAEAELQQNMNKYMAAAEHNRPTFFVLARRYRENLIAFHQLIRVSVQSMRTAIEELRQRELDKDEAERGMIHEFIDSVIFCDNQIRAAVSNAHGVAQARTSGEQNWQELKDKMGLELHDDPDASVKTVFDVPVSNVSGAVVTYWLESDIEMQAELRTSKTKAGASQTLLVTRWGFAQIFRDLEDEMPFKEFYVFDYSETPESEARLDSLEIVLYLRQHYTFGVVDAEERIQMVFAQLEARDKFAQIVHAFKEMQGVQT